MQLSLVPCKEAKISLVERIAKLWVLFYLKILQPQKVLVQRSHPFLNIILWYLLFNLTRFFQVPNYIWRWRTSSSISISIIDTIYVVFLLSWMFWSICSYFTRPQRHWRGCFWGGIMILSGEKNHRIVCPRQLIDFWISNICFYFLQVGAVEKIKTIIQNSTSPNRELLRTLY